MDEERSGLSIGDIFKIIFTRKWLALVIALALTVAGTLALYMGYNKSKSYYTGTFSIMFPGSDGDVPAYPDNTPFNYRDMVTRQNILDVKALGGDKFADIDGEKMYNQSAISVSRTNTAATADATEWVYTINAKSSFFDSENQAEEFIEAIAQSPIRYIKTLSINQGLFLTSFGETEFYEAKASALEEQAGYLAENISNIIAETGGELRIKCQLLATRINAFSQKLDKAVNEMRENLYVHSAEDVKNTYGPLVSAIDMQLTSKQTELDLLSGKLQESGDNVDMPRVGELAAEIARLTVQKSVYEKYTAEGAELQENKDFENNLNALNEELEKLTDDFENNLDLYYTNYSLVVFDGAIKSEGGMSLMTCVLVSLVAGVIIAAIIAFAIGFADFKKKNAAFADGEAPCAGDDKTVTAETGGTADSDVRTK